jgi:hypothetical protein
MNQKLYLGFPLSEKLQKRLLSAVEKAENTSNKKQYAIELFEIIAELSDEGLDYFFIQSLRKAKIGALSLKAVEMALSTGKKAILTVGKTIIKGMSDEQLSVVVSLMRDSLTLPLSDDQPKD